MSRKPAALLVTLGGLGIIGIISTLVNMFPAPKLDPAEQLQLSVNNTINSVVHITNDTQGWQGSGVAISRDTILTARHVLEGGEEFVVTTNWGQKVTAYKAISSNKYDIGFLKLEQPILEPAQLASAVGLRLGEPLYVIGSPFGKMNFNSVTAGIVSGVYRNYDVLNGVNYYGETVDYGWSVSFTTDSAGHPGNSGCPIFTYDGKVRGILVGGFSPVLIIAMPVDLILDDIAKVDFIFTSQDYHIEQAVKEPEYEDYADCPSGC